jgi:histidine triad (HIT) family protein
MFAYMAWAIPVKRLYETDALMAFYHPKPTHAVHILIVPKRAYASLVTVAPDDAAFMQDVFGAVHKLVHELNLEADYRLICNGGKHQDVPQLHFHLVSDLKGDA